MRWQWSGSRLFAPRSTLTATTFCAPSPALRRLLRRRGKPAPLPPMSSRWRRNSHVPHHSIHPWFSGACRPLHRRLHLFRERYVMAGKDKTATLKDVRYALEFGGERLLRTYTHDERQKGGVRFTLSRTGVPVSAPVASAILADPHVIAIEDGLLPGHSQQFEWRGE